MQTESMNRELDKRVVVVDDEEDVRLFCSLVMERLGYDVNSFASGEQALAFLASASTDLLITDAKMPGMSGIELIERVKALDPAIAALVITGYSTMEMAFEAIRAGAQDFLPKPFSVQDLNAAAKHALEQARQAQEYASMRAIMPLIELSQELVGQQMNLDEMALQITEVVCRVCKADGAAIVLINSRGEQRVLGQRGPFPAVFSSRCLTEQNSLEIFSLDMVEEGDFRLAMQQAGVGYMASAALEAPSGYVGTIALTSLADFSQFTRGSRHFLQAMSGQVAAIIENVRMMEELQEWNRVLEVRVAERTTELQNAQEQLINAQRLATIGELGASIAHEMRNPLGVISNSEYYLRMRLGDDDPKLTKHLDIIKREIAASNAIITELMSFVRATNLQPAPLDPAELCERCLSRIEAPSSITVVRDWPVDLPLIDGDQDRLEMVLMNLLNNAVQAMPDGGVLTLKAEESSDGVAFYVQDTGTGISKENMERIFEPLFTTKTRGIGLGLAIVRRLIDAHGGTIRVESELGKGTRFEVLIPVSERVRVPVA